MIKLSASRIKSYFSCSWYYYAKYCKKIPENGSNAGAARGSVVHDILECLLRADRRPMVEEILQLNDPFIPPIKRMARMLAKKFGVWNPKDFKLIGGFLLVALKLDFYHDGANEVLAEYEFDIKKNGWHIGGFVDKIAIYDDYVKIVDYKTNQNIFKPEELEFNLQNYFYCYAVKQATGKPVSLDFLFLKHKTRLSSPVISDIELEGFEEWLNHIGSILSNFSFENAVTHSPRGTKDIWLCGKPDGSRNKDGSLSWSCAYRSPFVYFELMEGENRIESSRKREELEKIKKEGQIIKERTYQGCHFWKKEWTS